MAAKSDEPNDGGNILRVSLCESPASRETSPDFQESHLPKEQPSYQTDTTTVSSAVEDVLDSQPSVAFGPEAVAANGAHSVNDAMTQPEALGAHDEDTSSDDADSTMTSPGTWEDRIRSLPLKISVGRFDFLRFKNRWGEENGYHVVELLICSENTAKEVTKEIFWREKDYEDSQRYRPTRRNRPEPALLEPASDTWIQRIRIHSPIILHYLLEATRTTHVDTDRPQVFFRPFKGLMHHHHHMKRVLKSLEEMWPDPEPGTTNENGGARRGDSTQTNYNSHTNVVSEEDKSTEHMLTGPRALEHLRCYVNFMDTEIMPMENEFRGTKPRTIRFGDLWYLYRVGEILYAPRPSTSQTNSEDKMRYQNAFMLHTKSVRITDDSIPNDITYNDCDFTLGVFYIDYDGESYGPVMKEFTIKPYSRPRDIIDLPVYPIRFAADTSGLMKNLRTQGSMFRKFACEKHVSCDGWTLANSPLGYSEIDETPEHVDGDVVVDFAEALRKHPSWKPEITGSSGVAVEESWVRGKDTLPIFHWPTGSKSRRGGDPLCSILEFTQRDDDTEKSLSDALITTDEFLKAFHSKAVRSLEDFDHELYDLILPRRIFVYVLRLRRFVLADLFSLSDISSQSDIFRDLKIDEDHKEIVQALVTDHFEKRRLQRQQPTLISMDQDLVRGKGSGLFVLLHGAPGVGKTATAEAVAQANRKPLFAITCGDLGISAEAVERNLNEIFRLAHIWDCVLLLDEADIFLAKRDNHNLKRNAIVSVFLRVLEYYKGILFLTTNRVGTLDEAFKSRIHISLYYEPLDQKQTIAIFRLNINKLREIEKNKLEALGPAEMRRPKLSIQAKGIIAYAEEHFKNHERTPHLRWNGRQIRNAFQIASSLAFHEALQQPGPASDHQRGPTLDITHFKRVAVVIERFGKYMEYTRNKTDWAEAKIEAVRATNIRNVDLAPMDSWHRGPEASSSGGPVYNQGHSMETEYDGRGPQTYGQRSRPMQVPGYGSTSSTHPDFNRRQQSSLNRGLQNLQNRSTDTGINVKANANGGPRRQPQRQPAAPEPTYLNTKAIGSHADNLQEETLRIRGNSAQSHQHLVLDEEEFDDFDDVAEQQDHNVEFDDGPADYDD